MAKFWLSKKMVLEALKLSEGAPQNTFIMFEGNSERKNGKEFTVMRINTCGKEKVLKEEFNKLSL